jgi:hypothetical protein
MAQTLAKTWGRTIVNYMIVGHHKDYENKYSQP